MLNSLCYNSQSNLFCIWNATCNHTKTVLLINSFFYHDLSKIRWRIKEGEGNIHIVNFRQLEAWKMMNLYSVNSQWGVIGGLILGSVGQLGCSCSMDSQCPLQFCKEQLFPSSWNIKWKSLFSLTLHMHLGGTSRLYFSCKVFPQKLEIKNNLVIFFKTL